MLLSSVKNARYCTVGEEFRDDDVPRIHQRIIPQGLRQFLNCYKLLSYHPKTIKMRTSTLVLISCHVAALFGAAEAFSTSVSLTSPTASSCLYSSAIADDETIPTNLPSECGMDYIPLATMLATGQFEEADQVRERKRRRMNLESFEENELFLFLIYLILPLLIHFLLFPLICVRTKICIIYITHTT